MKQSPETRVLQRKKRRLIFLVIVLPFIICGIWVYWQMNRVPEWWQPVDPVSAQAVLLAESLENNIISQIYKVRSEDYATWKIELNEKTVNNWLAGRLPKWAVNRLPGSILAGGQLKQVHVRFLPQSIYLGLRYDYKGDKLTNNGQVIAITLVPYIDSENNGLGITIKEVFLGRLPIPVDVAVNQFARLSGNNSEDLVSFILGEAVDPSISLSDDRQVRITNFYLVSGRLTIDCATKR